MMDNTGWGIRAAACLACLGIAAATPSARAGTPPDTLVVAQNIEGALTMDTGQLAEGNITAIFQSVCDKLVRRDLEDFHKLDPGIAEAWKISPDGQTVTFTIRPGLKFSGSGNPVTANDAVWSTKRLIKLGFGAAAELQQWGFNKDNIDQLITAPDSMTMQVKLPAPAPMFDVLYATFSDRPGFVLDSQEIMKHEVNGDLGNKWMQQRTACVGPFRLQVWKPGDAIVFQRNDDYFGPKPSLARMVFQNVPESGTQRLLLERGDADVAWDLNPTDIDAISQGKNARVLSVLTDSFAHLTFNHGKKPFDDARVVDAFRYLIDYQALSRTVYKGQGEIRQVLVPINAFGALSKEEGASLHLDLDKAKALITAAGYPNGFSASLWTVIAPGMPEIAQHIQENAAKIGINLTVEKKSDGDLFPRYRSRNFDIVLVSWAALYPDADAMVSRLAWDPDVSLESKLSHFPTWRAAWEDPWFNDMTLKGRTEQDPEKRKAIYVELQRRWLHEAPFVFLFQNYRRVGVSSAVKSLPQNPYTDFFGYAEK